MKLHLCSFFNSISPNAVLHSSRVLFSTKNDFFSFCTRDSRNLQARRLLQSGKNEHPQPPTHAPPPNPNPKPKKPKTNEQPHKPKHHRHKMNAPSPSPFSSAPKALPSPSASAPAISSSGSHHPLAAPPRSLISPSPSISPPHKHSSRNYSLVAAGSAVFVVMAAASVMYCRVKKVGTVRPWATGLSGQLQQAFVTGNFFMFCVHSLCFSISV